MTYFIILLIGFIWIIRDTIRVPETFNDSWFKKFKNHWYVDSQVSWINKGDINTFLYFVVVCFSDLFHLLGTMIISGFFLLIYFTHNIAIGLFSFMLCAFLCFGGGVWLGYQLFRKILNK